jgi:hypothetical protein
MARKDLLHNPTKQSLIKAGWTITHDPLSIKFSGIDFHIDLGANKILTANKGDENIAVEVKSFAGDSPLTAFHVAVGQFLNYRLVLREKQLDYTLFLAIPENIYESFFMTQFGQLAIKEHGLRLIVIDDEEEVITQWIH